MTSLYVLIIPLSLLLSLVLIGSYRLFQLVDMRTKKAQIELIRMVVRDIVIAVEADARKTPGWTSERKHAAALAAAQQLLSSYQLGKLTGQLDHIIKAQVYELFNV